MNNFKYFLQNANIFYKIFLIAYVLFKLRFKLKLNFKLTVNQFLVPHSNNCQDHYILFPFPFE